MNLMADEEAGAVVGDPLFHLGQHRLQRLLDVRGLGCGSLRRTRRPHLLHG